MPPSEKKELEEELMVALRNMRPEERFEAKGPLLVGGLRVGRNRVPCAEPMWMVL